MASRGRITVLLAVLVLALWPRAAAAHPADRLKQHLVMQLTPEEARLALAIGGGILANELVLADLDPNGDGTVGEVERSTWIAGVLADLRIVLDGRDVAVDAAVVSAQIPAAEDFRLGLRPLVLSLAVPIPATEGKAEHRLTVRNDYHLERTDFFFDVWTLAGAELVDEGWPGRTMRVAFTTDPAAGIDGEGPDAASAWDTGGVIARAKSVLERPKSPVLVFTLIAIFVLMGALHAVQPGHGKTLVAAYLVATKGTPRDALALAGIVTFTHTVSVFTLGLATLAASRVFLPSRVIPLMGVISGVLVVGVGLAMLRGAVRRSAESASSFEQPALGGHDHDHLSDEEHARVHLEEALAARREGVNRRGLVALGVSGGLAPCPDALAILLLAIGLDQAGLGMVAIVAFSFGLASVLIAFGLAIALAGPFWTRARASVAGHGRFGMRLNAGFGRLVAASPLVSASVVLVLGLAMIWRAGTGV